MNITLRARTPSDDPRLVELGNSLFPEFPPETVEDFRHELDTTPKTARREIMVAERDGSLVGSTYALEMWWNKEPGGFVAGVSVDPGQQGQGIGRLLYDHLSRTVERFEAQRVYSNYKEGAQRSEEFARRRGFAPDGRVHRMSRLAISDANLDDGYQGIEERLAAEGIRLTTLAEVGPDDEQFLRAVHEMSEETEKDMPTAEEPGTVPFEEWRKIMLEGPGKSPDGLWLAVDGERPVGLALLKQQDNIAWNWYTGVDRAYRGKGVARGLKLKTVEWARRRGVDYIYTGNDIDNKRMLDVNVRLGYKPIPNMVEVVKHLNSGA